MLEFIIMVLFVTVACWYGLSQKKVTKLGSAPVKDFVSNNPHDWWVEKITLGDGSVEYHLKGADKHTVEYFTWVSRVSTGFCPAETLSAWRADYDKAQLKHIVLSREVVK